MSATHKSALRARVMGWIVVGLATLSGSGLAQSQTATSELQHYPPLKWGVYDPHGTFTRDAKVSIEHVFIPWQDADFKSLALADRYASDRGRTLLVTLEPWTWSQSAGVADPTRLYTGIMQGQYDAVINSFCETFATFKSPVTIRWAHEMDVGNKRYPWSHWSGEQYIAAYRHFVTVCRAKSPAAKYMWSPRGERSLQDYYPGDQFVDSVGLSIFAHQAYETGVFGKTLSLSERVSPSYKLVAGYGKDIYIAEFGCHGDERFVKRCMEQTKSSKSIFPMIAGVIYFNEIETYPWPGSYETPDWRIRNTLLSEAAN